MGKILLVFASILVCQLYITADAQINFVRSSCDTSYTNFNYTEGSVYGKNLNLLFNDLTSKTSSLWFYNSSVGESSNNKVYGLYQCRHDVRLRVCNECVQGATQKIIEGCPLFGEAAAYYFECTLWYGNSSIYTKYATRPAVFWSYSVSNVSNYAKFAPMLANDMKGVIKNASSSTEHYASSESKLTLFETLYSFGQCTPDLDLNGCNGCLKTALSELVGYANESKWGMVLYPSCQLRYDTMAPILNQQSSLTPPPGGHPAQFPLDSPRAGKKSVTIIATAVALGVGLIILAIILWICLCCKKRKRESGDAPQALLLPSSTPLHGPEDHNAVRAELQRDEHSIGDTEFLQYDFATLRFATEDFSPENKLGEGGFGSVYKGTLKNGEQLAIKRLSGTGGQGTREFMTEARLLAKLQHRNLVKLLGFCSEGDEKLLAYEFMSNSSLDRFLFDGRNRTLLDWVLRYKIIMGIARGLQYLHEDSRLTIIHRDLKPANILLDKDMNPKVADFGLAKLFEEAETFGQTVRIVGTQGYMAPEYLMTGDYSNKSDVYSYGIMLLEIVSGQKNRVFQRTQPKDDLSIQAWKLWNARRSFEIIDPVLFNNCPSNDVMRCIQIGLLCVQANAEERPTMTAVVLMLTGSVDLPLPSPPAMSSNQYNNMPMNYSSGTQQRDQDQYSTKSVTMQTDMGQDLYPSAR